METANTLFSKVVKVMEFLLITIFAVLVFDVLFQVFSRYILKSSVTWTEELARFLLIWMTILGAAYLNAKREHLTMDFLYQKFSTLTKKKVSIIIEVLIILFALIVMVIGGFNLVYTTLHLGQISGTLQIPLGYIYVIFPFSGLLIIWFSIHHISLIVKNQLQD